MTNGVQGEDKEIGTLIGEPFFSGGSESQR